MLWKPKRALVLGVGPLGLLTVLLLRLRGLEVYAVARRGQESLKAKLVKRAGGVYINSQERPITSLGGFDIIMEVTGVPSVAIEAQGLLRENGVMCFLGIYRRGVESQDFGGFYTGLVLGNKTFFGSVNANRRYFESGVKSLQRIERDFSGILPDMLTTVVPPQDFMKTFTPDRDDIKLVLDFAEAD